MMQWIYINILFIVIIFLQNEHMLNRYKLDFIILGFGGLLLTTDSYRSTTTYYCIKKLTGDGDLGENIMLVTFSM